MGYCLLYEAMLDSVIWARDHYLKLEGLMVPSHCTLKIAPLSDPEYIDEHVHFWKNVYGFDMSGMSHDTYDDAMVQQVPSKAIVADAPSLLTSFLTLPLKTMTVDELSFEGKPFAFHLNADIESLDGFVVWFDTFFLTTPHGELPALIRAEDFVRMEGDKIAFTTGPFGKDTHWHQGVLLINYHSKQPEALRKGQDIEGTIGYNKRRDDGRALDINVSWRLAGGNTRGKQTWSMR